MELLHEELFSNNIVSKQMDKVKETISNCRIFISEAKDVLLK